MADESNEPSGGGGLKYGIIGLMLIGGAVVIWFAMNAGGGEQTKNPSAPGPQDAGVQRSTSLAEPEIVIPEEDAGHDAGKEEVVVKHVVKYVDRRQCTGKIAPQKALAVINQHRSQVRNCYERRLKVNNALQGRVQMRLTIGRNGQVSGVSVGGSLGDPQVFSCVRSLAKRWTFPEPEGGCAVVAAPFNFTPKN